MDAIILAAGKGTRLGKISEKIPKSLVQIQGKPIIEYTFQNLPDEIDRVILVVGHLNDQIKNFIGNIFLEKPVEFVEVDTLGTGYSVWQCQDKIQSEKFLVLNGDDFYNKEELTSLIEKDRCLGLAISIPRSPKYLSIKIDSNNWLTGSDYVSEKELESEALIATGAYVLDRGIFNLELVKIQSTGEYGLPQTILKNLTNYPIKGEVMKHWIQINYPEDITRAEEILKNKF